MPEEQSSLVMKVIHFFLKAILVIAYVICLLVVAFVKRAYHHVVEQRN